MLKWLKCCSNRKTLSIPVLAAVVAFVIVIMPSQRQRETPHEAAKRICKECGMFGLEIDELIQQVRESGLTPEESLQSWRDTADPENKELCMPCVKAVIEAAG